MDLRTRRLTRLTKTGQAAEASPNWSPDGRQIVFVSDRVGRPHLYVLSSHGGQEKRLTFRGRENVAPSWGPDGRIAYSSRREGRYHICVTDPRTGADTQLTSDYVDHEDPSWAADGRHIVYTRTEGYRSDVYVLDTMGDPQVRLTRLQGDWYSPAWSSR
jgi:TolB protein